MEREVIVAGFERLRAKREAEEAQSARDRSIYGPWPDYVRAAIADWPRSPIVSAELRRARADSYVCYGDTWPLIVKEKLTDAEVAELLKSWLHHHPVRRAIARFVAKKTKTHSDAVMKELLDLRDQAEDRVIEHEERVKLLGEADREGIEEGGEVRGGAVRGGGEQPPGEDADAPSEPGGEGAAEEGRPEGLRPIPILD